ncbi:pyridoxamine 5'-phosphate oxidase-related FMN-binding [Anaeromyxobacter sp. K]|uniref:HugZ family pyridoxamine 5'-phosphate oxidase n=1 Tax=Anaeromyxobacter sp. (strain K) TaxID=447217 RepID=UPI00015F8A22|nr:pyridoxamine 5'-phosphate oxidase family protein [Anaeromyxobacter sp. K]ACG72139.1 pyridoxamine 5'-phosphate oxidase-related FMN-binding [Anaeromyxobacter sp. K]
MAGHEAEERAQAGAERAGGIEAVRGLLERERVGVLSTISSRHAGWPYGTLVPFAVAANGEPLLLLSALAQHTQNLAADPRCTLLVFDGEAARGDPRTAARATLVGRAVRVGAAEEEDAVERYAARVPGAKGLLALDFALWRLEVMEVQLVGGFAAAGFFPGEALRER